MNGEIKNKLQRGLALTVKESWDLYKYIEELEQEQLKSRVKELELKVKVYENSYKYEEAELNASNTTHVESSDKCKDCSNRPYYERVTRTSDGTEEIRCGNYDCEYYGTEYMEVDADE